VGVINQQRQQQQREALPLVACQLGAARSSRPEDPRPETETRGRRSASGKWVWVWVCCLSPLPGDRHAACFLPLSPRRGGYPFLGRAPYKQQAVENRSIICQIKTEPPSWTTAAASFVFYLYLASARLAPVVALASTGFANPAFSYLAVVLVRALRGIQSPEGEGTEISLL
jgi:hypothetical protein